MQEQIIKANSKGFLLPFKNGVLNTKTLQLLEHKANLYVTHIIPMNYTSEASIINTKFELFLNNITNNNEIRLQILRACLNLIFTNNLSFQVALYIYSPGGSGKSTFVNILQYLLGSEASISTSLNHINSKFGIYSIVGKILVVLNDVSFYKGPEPKHIKEIITQDRMQSEQKFKPLIYFTPNSFLLLTSNMLWDIKYNSTGLSRRMIYFPFDYIPKNKYFELFKLAPTGEASGTLLPFLSGFINWILSCPKEDIEKIKLGGNIITELISPDLININPLSVFAKDSLVQSTNPKSNIKIGNNYSNKETLFGAYSLWAKENGVTILKFNQFSNLLLDLLKQQGWNVSKKTNKRVTSGYVITGIEFKIKNKTKTEVK
jgi:P4 family phage/plasmid primase-like protien